MRCDFSGDVAFNVYREGRPHVYLGNTLDDAPSQIALPDSGGWFVRPVDPALAVEHLPAILGEVARLSISGLSLAACRRIDDRGLDALAWPRLEFLELFNTSVGDQGLTWLRRVPGLLRLSLAGTKVSDAGMAAIAALPRLVELDLGWTAITDQGLEALRGHPGLVSLSLRATRVSDRGLELVATLPRLRHLDLQETGIGDAGVARLRPLAGTLEDLWLGYTALTNGCVADLATLGRLRTLMLRVTQVGTEKDRELAVQLRELGTKDGRGIIR